MSVLLCSFSLLVFFVNLFFVVWLFRGIKRIDALSVLSENPTKHSFSIIIAAHNEANNITKCLDSLINQNYPKSRYEIIVLADRCIDNTVYVVQQFKPEFPNLKILEINEVPAGLSPKKYILNEGIQEASHNHFLFMDADVIPTKNHIKTFNQYFNDEADAVVGIMKLKLRNNFWQNFLRYERILNWSVAVGGIGYGKPILSYGGNWGYTRQAFNQVGGFENTFQSLGGDDDLLLQKLGRANLKIRFCANSEGWVITPAPDSLQKFLHQRRRHFAAGKYYQKKFKVGYFLYHVSNLLIWIMPIVYLPAVLLLILKILVNTGFVKTTKVFFREELRLHFVPIFEFLFMAYNALVGPLAFLGRIKW